jgi:hypothetical protein
MCVFHYSTGYQIVANYLFKFLRHAVQRVSQELNYRIDICRVTKAHLSNTCKVGQKLGVSLPLLTCSPSAWPSRLLYHRGRKSRRDLWITLCTAFTLGCRKPSKKTENVWLVWRQRIVSSAILRTRIRLKLSFTSLIACWCVNKISSILDQAERTHRLRASECLAYTTMTQHSFSQQKTISRNNIIMPHSITCTDYMFQHQRSVRIWP